MTAFLLDEPAHGTGIRADAQPGDRSNRRLPNETSNAVAGRRTTIGALVTDAPAHGTGIRADARPGDQSNQWRLDKAPNAATGGHPTFGALLTGKPALGTEFAVLAGTAAEEVDS